MKNNSFTYKILIAGLSIVTLFSCKSENKESTDSKEETNTELDLSLSNTDKEVINALSSITKPDTLIAPSYESLKTVEQMLTYLRNRESYTWKYLAFTESEKYANVDRMIEEIGFNNSHKPSDIKKAKIISQKLKALFLRRKDINDVSKIQNDALNDSLLSAIFEIGELTPNMENHSLFGELRSEILEQNNNLIVNLRGIHSTAANNLNEFIDLNIEEIKSQGLNAEKVTLWTSGESDGFYIDPNELSDSTEN